ncbi:arrestin domain-containing protein 5-like isoform X1 [Pomacea canaliculata]|uniref:arrestin domain-containing protein 5-like isoform X1 n=2 Tax=Pomacea canaliculata TaxID=400727 RepID=UPI000D72E1FC|nr:arrestin domain-containing protein 5-like isoform X1 [Pomacea canaliculata]
MKVSKVKVFMCPQTTCTLMAESKIKYRFVLPKNVYCGGQTIKGQLHIESPSPVLLSNLQVRLRGRAKVQLVREENGTTRTLYQTQTYLDKRLGVQDMQRLPESDNLPQGTGLFAFEFLLPPGLPPSFTSPLGGWPICGDTIFQMGLVEEDYIISQCGFLCYCLDLLRRDRGREVIRFRQLIHIITRPSLGVDASASQPVERELHHARHWFCCVASKDILFKAWLDQPEVIMGDKIPFHAEITNNSDIFVKSSYITLIATWVFHAMDETEVKSEKIKSFKKVKRCAIPPGESMTWGDNDEPLVLPADLTPTGPPNCSIMEVSYELSFTVVPRGMFSSMKVRLPITATFGLTQSDRERLAAETSHGNA